MPLVSNEQAQSLVKAYAHLRILHVISTVDPNSGGPIEGVIRQDEATKAYGVREVVSCDAPEAAYLTEFPLTVHALGLSTEAVKLPLLSHYRFTPHLVPWLRANASSYDAIIVNGLWNFATLAAAITLPGGKTPYYVFTHGMMDPWFRRTYPLKHLAKQAFWSFCEGRLLAGAAAVLFTTEEERLLARGQFLGWRYKEKVVGYGTASPPPATALQEAVFRKAVPALGVRPYLLYLSRIHKKKGCDLLIEAFARVADDEPGLDLVLAGPDQTGWTRDLKASARRLGIENRVHIPGGLFGDAKWGAMYGAEAFILPSHQETFGIVVAEALACGTPVLISDKVNIWREIEAEGAGFVESDTLAGTERLLRRWIGLDSARKESLGLAASHTFAKYFDVRVSAARLLQFIGPAT